MPGAHDLSALSPVSADTGEGATLEEGTALSLSGGGYRAMLFHTGVLWRLNELGHLPRLDRVSSVSGGSITAAALATAWAGLDLERHAVSPQFEALVVRPVRKLARQTIDARSILGGILRPRQTIGEAVGDAFRKFLVGDTTLQGLPDRPRFVINATNMQTGSLWRFSKPYMADYRVGVYPDPRVDLAVAVAASAAFPPLLSPVRLALDPDGFSSDGRGPQHMPPYTTDVRLSDGGVYDNLGLETTWKRYRTILVSDGGGQMAPTPKPGTNWLAQAQRVQSVTDNQVRSLRKRQTIAGFARGDRDGTYWGIRSDIENFSPPSGRVLPCPQERTLALARTPTRLRRMPDELQERLINWGYAICDAAMRTYVVASDPVTPPAFPYPQRGVG